MEPEETGGRRNSIPAGSAIRAGAGVIVQQPAFLRYDQPLPRVLSADGEHRITAQVRVVLSPEAHLVAATAWRESLWVDLGIGGAA